VRNLEQEERYHMTDRLERLRLVPARVQLMERQEVDESIEAQHGADHHPSREQDASGATVDVCGNAATSASSRLT
jgi:hypothetical protein